MNGLGTRRAWLAIPLAITVAFSVMGCGSEKAAEEPVAEREFYEGFEQDLQAFRQTQNAAPPGEPPRMVPTGEAVGAATRVFERVDLVGMTKDEVLELLGDPATISGYGIPAEPGPDEPLIYRFDCGFGGVQYTLPFEDGKVVSVEEFGIY